MLEVGDSCAVKLWMPERAQWRDAYICRALSCGRASAYTFIDSHLITLMGTLNSRRSKYSPRNCFWFFGGSLADKYDAHVTLSQVPL